MASIFKYSWRLLEGWLELEEILLNARTSYIQKAHLGGWEGGSALSALAVLTEDLSLIASTHTMAHNHL